ncbi:MAG: universal stress protein [Gemmatimonadota bacterium]
MSSSATHSTSETLATLEPTRFPEGPIVVATDTTESSDAAIPLAGALASMARADAILVSVMEPVNVPIYGVDGMVVSMENAEETRDQRRSAAAAQLMRMRPGAAAWPVTVTSGEPAHEVTRHAHDLNARLIVVGRGRHHGVDRLLGGEAVLRMLQLGDTPVLAVEPTLTAPPRRVVVATDFSPFSLYAAQVAMTVAAPDATVWLLHVGPPFDETVPFLRDRAEKYREMSASAFARIRSALPDGRHSVQDVVLTGSAPDALLDFLAAHDADLVVSATHGYGFLRRMILGSVAATLIRRAHCSVLAVPGSARTVAAARAQQVPNANTRGFATMAMDAELAAFTTRNIGRRCTVEVDTGDMGAQVLGHDLMLAGASFDHHSTSVAIMFGTSTLKGMHLTHSISGVTGIDLSGTAGGSDQVLRIAHTDGQTLLTLH